MRRPLRVLLFAFAGVASAGLLLGAVVPVVPAVARPWPVGFVLIGCVVLAIAAGEWLAARRS
jgi:hypothetical protein